MYIAYCDLLPVKYRQFSRHWVTFKVIHLWQAFSNNLMRFFVHLCNIWQDFNWHSDALRHPRVARPVCGSGVFVLIWSWREFQSERQIWVTDFKSTRNICPVSSDTWSGAYVVAYERRYKLVSQERIGVRCSNLLDRPITWPAMYDYCCQMSKYQRSRLQGHVMCQPLVPAAKCYN